MLEKKAHQLSDKDVFSKLESCAHGLSAAAVKKRQEKYGANRLPGGKKSGPVARFFRQFRNLLILVLIGAALLTASLQEWLDSAVIMAVVLVNALIGFIQEGKAEQAIAAVSRLLEHEATVRRDGRSDSIASHELVPGDVVLLEAGDRVPADLRFFKIKNISISEAALTGESMPVFKETSALSEDTSLAERCNMAYAGTLVEAGQGEGVVVAIGEKTEMGRINRMLQKVEKITTPLLKKMNHFSRILTFVILSLALLIFAMGLAMAVPLNHMVLVAVAIAVAAIPEGLPIILTVTLAIGVRRMAEKNAIIRRLPAVETLGSVQVICSDKTGTITKNEMQANDIVLRSGELFCDNFAAMEVSVKSPANALDWFGLTAVLCNDAHYNHGKTGGEPTEVALLEMALSLSIPIEEVRKTYKRLDNVPFDASYRYMATLHEKPDDKSRVILLKGAPEAIFKRCAKQYHGNKTADFDKAFWHEKVEALAKNGQRTLALAMKPVNASQESVNEQDCENDLIMAGLAGMIDPPRPEVIDAIADCHKAGIEVKMITGDHPLTAQAIARKIGLQSDMVLTGLELEEMDDASLLEKLDSVDVFARTAPEHKLRLVELLQKKGCVIAMTGDGVNDSPALRRADIGVAMGKKGTEAAREASEMVLMDDNFASISEAVRQGRAVWDNLRKAILFLLPVNGGESLSLLIGLVIFAWHGLPISPVQVLWVNMVSSVILAMALAFEPEEPGIMTRPPADSRQGLLSPRLLGRILYVSLLMTGGILLVFTQARNSGLSLEIARTMTVNTLVALEVAYLFSARYLHGSSLTRRGLYGTRPVLLALAMVLVMQMLFTYFPPMHRWFGTAPLSFIQLLTPLVFAAPGFMLMELEKLGSLYWRQKRSAF